MIRIISPSLLSANFINLNKDIEIVEKMGVERLHLDVMDGHFVPNLTFGPFIINQIRKKTNCHLESHLMISNHSKYIEDYARAGSDTIIIHYETSENLKNDLKVIRSFKVLSGVAINPDTDANLLEPYLDYIDYILIMSVFPGFGGQSFIEETLKKMELLKEMTKGRNILLSVDGGVNLNTINKIYQTGVDITVVGSALYGANNIESRYKQLMNA